MKQLQFEQMENIQGGSWKCLGAGLSALTASSPTGPLSLLIGVSVYSACSLFLKD